MTLQPDQDDIPAQLLEIVERIYAINQRMREISRKNRPNQNAISSRNDEVFVEVCAEVDENGKPRFPNDRLRQIEHRMRLREDVRYVSYLDILQETQNESEDLTMESNHLLDLKEILYIKAEIPISIETDPPPLGQPGAI